jgi:hypothetical protein
VSILAGNRVLSVAMLSSQLKSSCSVGVCLLGVGVM